MISNRGGHLCLVWILCTLNISGTRCSSSWSNRSRNCTRCSWTLRCWWRTRERWWIGGETRWSLYCHCDHQDWRPCWECGRVHHQGDQRHQEGTRVPDQSPQVRPAPNASRTFSDTSHHEGRRSWCSSVSSLEDPLEHISDLNTLGWSKTQLNPPPLSPQRWVPWQSDQSLPACTLQPDTLTGNTSLSFQPSWQSPKTVFQLWPFLPVFIVSGTTFSSSGHHGCITNPMLCTFEITSRHVIQILFYHILHFVLWTKAGFSLCDTLDAVFCRKKIMILICMIVAGSLGTYIALKYLGFFWIINIFPDVMSTIIAFYFQNIVIIKTKEHIDYHGKF